MLVRRREKEEGGEREIKKETFIWSWWFVSASMCVLVCF